MPIMPSPWLTFDLVVMGEGKKLLTSCWMNTRSGKTGGGSAGLLARAAGIKGVYIPGFYDVDYNHDGTICSVKPNRPGVPSVVQNG